MDRLFSSNRMIFIEEDPIMPDRINTPFTNEHFADWCLKMAEKKSPYWYGCCVYKASASRLASKSAQYPDHYGSNRTARYKQDIANKQVVADCVGGCKGYAWTGGGQDVLEAIGTDNTFTNKYGSHGCPDKSANGMFNWAKSQGMEWGTIGTLPEIVGLALRCDGHIGYYIGGGCTVEWRGFSHGCVKTQVSTRSWTHWFKLPFIDYGNEVATTEPVEISLGSRLLRKGMKGTDVKTLQNLLLQLGFDLPQYGADGDFGTETMTAVLLFQKKYGVARSGEYDELTHATLMAAVADDDVGHLQASGEEPETKTAVPEPQQKAGTTVVISANGGQVNVRSGNGTQYARLSTVPDGTAFVYVATAENGWHAVEINGQVGWVSGKYAKRV